MEEENKKIEAEKPDEIEAPNCDKLLEALKEKEKVIEELNQEITGLKIEKVKLQEQMRKESEVLSREAERKANKIISELIIGFLDIVDNFDRALESFKNENKNSIEGLVLIRNQIEKFLSSYGVKEIDLAEKTYDPNYCEIGEVIESDEYKPNTVIRVLRKGFLMKDKVLRTAIVSVAVSTKDNKD